VDRDIVVVTRYATRSLLCLWGSVLVQQ